MEIANNIHLLKIDFEINLDKENTISRFVNVILVFGDTITLIDTGVKDSWEAIQNYIERHSRKVSEIKTVILSHSHPDHIGNAAKIKALTNCRILAHKQEKEWIENIEIQNTQRPVPGFFNLVNASVVIDEYISNGQELKIQDGLTLQVVELPGHSKGLVGILFKEDKIFFTADAIQVKNDIPNYDNYTSLIQSLQKIKDNTEYDILLTSWMPSLTNKEEIERLVNEGEQYLKQIDDAVKSCYIERSESLECCRQTINKLNLPAFLVNPIVDKAFRSHFS